MVGTVRLPRFVAAVACALLVVGCGSTADGERGASAGSGANAARERPPTTDTTARDDPAAVTGPLPGACELITESDAAKAFGEPVVAGTQGRDECWWSTANDLKTVNVVRRNDDVATWRAGYQNQYWTPNGLGDEGYTGKVFTSEVFRLGDVQYEINVVYSTRGDPAKAARDLAAIVLSRL